MIVILTLQEAIAAIKEYYKPWLGDVDIEISNANPVDVDDEPDYN